MTQKEVHVEDFYNSLFTLLPLSVSGCSAHTSFPASLKYISGMCPGLFVVFMKPNRYFTVTCQKNEC